MDDNNTTLGSTGGLNGPQPRHAELIGMGRAAHYQPQGRDRMVFAPPEEFWEAFTRGQTHVRVCATQERMMWEIVRVRAGEHNGWIDRATQLISTMDTAVISDTLPAFGMSDAEYLLDLHGGLLLARILEDRLRPVRPMYRKRGRKTPKGQQPPPHEPAPPSELARIETAFNAWPDAYRRQYQEVRDLERRMNVRLVRLPAGRWAFVNEE